MSVCVFVYVKCDFVCLQAVRMYCIYINVYVLVHVLVFVRFSFPYISTHLMYALIFFLIHVL